MDQKKLPTKSHFIKFKSSNYLLDSKFKNKMLPQVEIQTTSQTPQIKKKSSITLQQHIKNITPPVHRNSVLSPKTTFDQQSKPNPNKGIQSNINATYQRRSTLSENINLTMKHSELISQSNFDDIVKTRYDQDMQKYKYMSQNPQFLRKEGVQDLIFKKKSFSKLKYNLTKIKQRALPVVGGTISLMLNKNKSENGFNIDHFKKKIPARSKFKMKWKTIQYLLNNRKEAIQQIFNNYSVMLKFAKQRKGGMNRAEFCELLSYVGLGADQNLCDKLFYIFDEDSNGTVDYKELIIGLEIFKEDSIEEKMKVFFDLCDVDGSGNITQKELYEVLKQNFVQSEDKKKLKRIIEQIFIECDRNGDGLLDKQEILEAAQDNNPLRQLLEESIRSVKQIDQLIENDLEQPFHCWVPISANFANYRDGIHFPVTNNIMKVLGQVEQLYEENKNRKILYKSYDKKDGVITNLDDSLDH